MTAGAGSPPRRRVIVVPGMHRAGTSAVARGLQALAIDLGDALMSPDARMNARGFFEDLDVVELDDALLAAHGADWKSSALLAHVDWDDPAHAASRDAATRLLERKLKPTGQFAFKDPRVPRLLPFWQRVFADMDVDDAYVIAVRHPQAVIDSLVARDRLDVRRGGWLWLTHLVAALYWTQRRPRVVVDYDRMLEVPARELARIARVLGLPADVMAGADVISYARDFLTTDLRHATYGADDAGAAGANPLVAEAHALAQRLACDDLRSDGADAHAAIAALRERLAHFGPLLDYAGDVERAADEVPRLQGELAWAQASFADAQAYAADLAATRAREHADALADRAAHQHALAVAHAYSTHLADQLDARNRERASGAQRIGAWFDRLGARLARGAKDRDPTR